jgi:hypothetical protein
LLIFSHSTNTEDLSEIVHRVRTIAGAAANSEEEDPAAVGLYLRKQIRHLFNRRHINLFDDLARFAHVLFSVTHQCSLPLK